MRPDPYQRRTLADALVRAQRQEKTASRDLLFSNRLRSIVVPMVPGTRVVGPLPGQQAAVVADPNTGQIHTDGGLNRFTGAHESFHMLEARMTDADKARFARVSGMPNRPWEVGQSGAVGQESDGYRSSLSEVLADWAAMVTTRHDPRSNKVVSGYLDSKDMPSRRELLRFGRSLERFGARNGLPGYVRPSRG